MDFLRSSGSLSFPALYGSNANPVSLALVASTIWIGLWVLRSDRDPTKRSEGYIFLFLLAFIARRSAWQYSNTLLSQANLQHIGTITVSTTGFVLGYLIYHYYLIRASATPFTGKIPWLLPSRTSHTRIFPKKHSFSYSYLQVAVPVESCGNFGSLISVGDVDRRGWFHVDARDYLERNSEATDLKGRLSSYLKSQGINEDQWHYAYLITAPRFLGYAFNPVSFWYIYTSQDVLSTMILEVNNTFDERRMYLLQGKHADEKSEDSHSEPPTPPLDLSRLPKSTPNKFKNAWTKDFHVSPFSSRKGYYMLTAVDPFQDQNGGPRVFNNNITLKSSKDHIKLIARVFSDGRPINPLTSSWREIIWFIFTWFWIGFLTFPRILKEAASLFWARGLHVWFRPEVTPTSIGRQEAEVESQLASFFDAYLKTLVKRCGRPIRLLYTSNLKGSTTQVFSTELQDFANDQAGTANNLEIKVLSPVFFARFVHYAHTREAFDRECVFTDEKSRTIWVSRPDLLYELIGPESKSHSKAMGETFGLGPLDRLRWSLHQQLRCPPSRPAYPLSTSPVQLDDIRKHNESEMDDFVMKHCSQEAWLYRRLCARLFLAQRLALGFVPVIDVLDFVVRVLLIYSSLSSAKESLCLRSVLAVLGPHVYSIAKGTK